MAAHARLKNEFTKDEKYHNLMTWLIESFETSDSVGGGPGCVAMCFFTTRRFMLSHTLLFPRVLSVLYSII